MANKQKYYGVRVGRVPGVYSNWSECQQQTIGFPGATFKGFLTPEEAQEFIATQADSRRPATGGEDANETKINIYTDGSFAKGRYSWGFAAYENGELIFNDKGIGEDVEAAELWNVAGEMAAVVKAIEWAEANSKHPITIYHDYTGLAHWAEGSWKAKNRYTQTYAAFTSERLSWVRFNKVAGHAGIEGNELADNLAKRALRNRRLK
jgi:viroplasmin and RNaseH domain-containing protein